MCANTIREAIKAVVNGYRVSRETWELIDAEQRKDLPPAWGQTPAECPVQLVAPPSAEEIEAGDKADEAWRKIEDKIAVFFRQPAPRAADCGRGAAVHMRRDARDRNGVDEMMRKPGCKRSTCPHCWRLRVCKTLRRAAACLLDASNSEPGHRPRLGVLYVAECDWIDWQAKDKAIRRLCPECVNEGGRCILGRLRVRTTDNRLLIVCERDFRGARAMKPREALDLVSRAIDKLNPEQHSFRLLGSWSDSPKGEWRVVAHYEHVDMDALQRDLKERGARVRSFKSQDARGLIWGTKSKEAGDLLLSSCPSLSEKKKTQQNSDTANLQATIPDGFDLKEAGIPDGFDPGDNPWLT